MNHKHCDDYINDFKANKHLRWYLLVHRMPASDRALAEQMGVKPQLYADYQGKRVRVVMASRLGDVGITYNLKTEYGYSKRVLVEDLTNFSDTP